MFLKKNIIQHQQNIEKLIIDYKLLKKAMNFLYKKRIIKAGGINMVEKECCLSNLCKKLSR